MKKYQLGPPQDWHHYFQEIFKVKKINNLLEFGLGVGTEFLLENCGEVTSVELSLGSYNLEWYQQTKQKLKEYKNWEVFYIDLPDDIKNADSRAQNLKFPLENTEYLKTLKDIAENYINRKKYDFIFVDAGIHLRGDLVNMCFGKTDIIAAHDTSRVPYRVIPNVYGYNIVDVPENYTELYYECTYMGTTIWIRNEHSELIQTMKKFKV
jgi:hypothetical protein